MRSSRSTDAGSALAASAGLGAVRPGDAELELGVGDEDPGACGDGGGVAVQGERPLADGLGQLPGGLRRQRPLLGDVPDHPVEVDVLVVLALRGLGRRA